MNRIEKKFQELRRSKRKAFIAFITAGYPNLATTEGLAIEFETAGVDVLELGIPFTDPLADGPIIQESSQAALENHVRLVDVLHLVKRIRSTLQMPICLMTYYNPIFCFGEEKFIRHACASGVDGVIVPDLPPEEGHAFIRSAAKSGLDVICFVSPTTSRTRIKFIVRVARGFIYYVSLAGVTGPRKKLPPDLMGKLKEIKGLTQKAVCAGFGISHPEQVRRICQVADGVIVGSAIVKKIKENIGRPDLVKKVGNFVRFLKGDGRF